jgi:hypothetical protein
VTTVTLVSVALLTPWVTAQDNIVEELKAQYIERFPGFIEWPAGSSVGDTAAPFVIGVIGRSDLRPSLEGIARRAKIKGKQVEVRSISSLSQINGCQVLFISRSERGRLGEILGQARGNAVLTIGDTDGFASRGVMINFFTNGDSLRFKINKSSAEAAGLRMADKLLSLGEPV